MIAEGTIRRRPQSCPRCAHQDWRSIVYGLPSFDLFQAADRGEVVLGGCMVEDEQPSARCGNCGQEWPDYADPSELVVLPGSPD